MANNNTRIEYLDFIRIIAIYMVLFNHTGKDGFLLFTESRASFFYPVYLYISIFIKIAVPLFYMTSGALLLNIEESYSRVLKRFFRILLVLVSASLVAYLYNGSYSKDFSFSVGEFLVSIFKKPVISPYWYMYQYLAYILMLPFLRCLAKNLSRRGFYWLFLMHGIVKLMPIIEYIVWKGEVTHYVDFKFFISSNYALYPLLGYYIAQRMDEREFNYQFLLRLVLLSFFAMTITAFITNYKCSYTDDWSSSASQTFFNDLIYIPTFTAFYAVKMAFMKIHPGLKLSALICRVGSATFGLYLIEHICRRETYDIFLYLKEYFPVMIACWIWILAAGTIGIIVAMLLKQIPVVKKYI